MAFTPTDPTKAEVRITGTSPNQQLDFYIPAGPKGDPGPQGAGGTFDYSGTGSPVGVVAPASAGRIYLDTAGTNGAWRWMSTGTSNTSWTVIYGDTGWRVLATGTTDLGTGNSLMVRMTANAVYLYCAIHQNTTAGTIATLGTEWRPKDTDLVITGQRPGVNNSVTELRVSNGAVTGLGGIGVTNQHYNGSWIREGAWPTALPGTAG